MMQTQQCLRLFVWNGHWQLKDTFSTAEELRAKLPVLVGSRRYKVEPGTRKVAHYTEPYVGTAKQHREQQADRMTVRRQALTYYKSGSNGTEIPALPKESC